MNEETKRFVIKLAREAVETSVKNRNTVSIPENYPDELTSSNGVFVTINKKEVLRGCIGCLQSRKAIENLIEAATSVTLDPRFPPLEEDELDDIIIEVSILNTPQLIKVNSPREYLKNIEPNKDGLIIKKEFNQGLFLPQVWEVIPDKFDFLSNLCLKADLPSLSWLNDSLELYKFQAEVIKESVEQ